MVRHGGGPIRSDAQWPHRPDDGQVLRSLDDVRCVPGSADHDGDGCADLLVTRNVRLEVGARAPRDLWRKGRIEIVSGKDGSILRSWDESILPP